MAIELTSTAFSEGERVPVKYTGDGEDVSPPLSWSGLPEGTRELALICDDPDAPTAEPWVHWVIYKIPAELGGLPEGVAKTPRLAEPGGGLQGKNSWPSGQTIGYRGPAPPPGHGVHRWTAPAFPTDWRLTLSDIVYAIAHDDPVTDPRAQRAVDLLMSWRRPDGSWTRGWHTTPSFLAGIGASEKGEGNPIVTAHAAVAIARLTT